MLRKLLRILLLFFIVLILSIFLKTFFTRSRQPNIPWSGEAYVNRSAATHLAECIRFKTISWDDSIDGFIKKIALKEWQLWMEKTYPNCHKNAGKKIFDPGSILYTFKGTDETLKPALFLAHLDVVPADISGTKKWKYHPFEGVVASDTIYGRGALDDKAIVVSLFEAMEQLISSGFKPKRTILFAFGHDEETGGKNGAKVISEYLSQQKIEPEFIADEGFGVLEGLVPGITRPVAVIGTAEKGFLSLRLKVDFNGGHSSMPKKETAISVLSSAIQKLNSFEFSYKFCEPMEHFFAQLAPEMSFGYRVLFTNMWITSPLVKMVMKGNEKTAASLHTTMVATRLHAGVKDNVVPNHAEATFNFRILPGESIESVEKKILEIIDDSRVKISRGYDLNNPSPVSAESGPGYDGIIFAAKQTFKNVLVTPGLVVTGTDCKNYIGISKNIYRFVPIRLTNETIGTIHGENERISVKDLSEAIKYYRIFFSRL